MAEEGAGGGAAGGAGGAPLGVCDVVLLSPLTEDAVLHNLHMRYKHDLIYTYAGNMVISVNPCRQLPLYSAELARAYLARAPYQLPPHVYAVAATAYRWVRDRGESQCIVVTGESGAGKTEAARVCLQCAVLAGAGGGAGGAGGALTAAGTLLEAFGNAATLRNHNASRFGKLLDVEFDFRGDPVGGRITHYLLEKSRVRQPGEGERNFHVFYQLLAGADAHLLKRLKLQRCVTAYRILCGGDPGWSRPTHACAAAAAAAAGDEQHFAFTTAAMRALGLEAASGGVLRLLAFILKMGNVEFVPAPHIDGSLGARPANYYEVGEACALLGVDEDLLLHALGAAPHRLPAAATSHDCEAESSCSVEECDTETESEAGAAGAEGAAWAATARDRLLAALYSRLFVWLVDAVNEHIQPREFGKRPTLATLDMYGLESLARNSLEQLVINYAAERVQHALVVAARREQDLYEREGLPWQRVPLAHDDPDPLADLLDAGPESVLGVLRDCSARGLPDVVFLQRLGRRRHPRLLPLPPHHFQIHHFGGAVTYTLCGIVEKNRDAVGARVAAVLHSAREPLLRDLFPDGAAGRSPSPRRPAALSCRQRAVVGALARRLAAGPSPRLVRCLRADSVLRARHFDAQLVRHQIRTQSIMEMVRVRRAGWCEAMCARELLVRYGLLRSTPAPPPTPPRSPRPSHSPRPSTAEGGVSSPVRAARRLLRALPIPGAEFAYGRSKVFIRSPRTVWELEALRWARVVELVQVVQRTWRRYRARRLARTQHRAQRVIARAWRRHKRQRRAQAAVTERRTAWAAVTIQGLYLRWLRRRYLCSLWARLPQRHMSPLCASWPPCPAHRLAALDALLRHIHHRWRCHKYRTGFDQTARNRMREKVTASILFKERKQNYPRSVAHPFVGDYVRLRASAAWRRVCAAAPPHRPHPDHYVVFADVVGKVARSSGKARPTLAVVSTGALLMLEARSLRVKRRVPAPAIYRLSLSPFADDVLVVHVRACPGVEETAGELASQCSSRDAPDAPGCLFAVEGAARRKGDLVLQTCHVLELATKLFLVVQNAVGAPPHVNIASEFEANFGQQIVTMSFGACSSNASTGTPNALTAQSARVVRRGSRMDVLL